MKNLINYFSIFFAFFIINSYVKADNIYQSGIELDGTFGLKGEISLENSNYNILEEYGKLRNTNLFHSFKKFNLNKNETAIFSGSDNISNIIARITGGSQSWIDGKICSSIPDANLFLINPKGFLFGSNASLDIKGSFYLSSADYLKFDNDNFFYSIPLEKEIFSSEPPEAFGFINNFEPISFNIQQENLQNSSASIEVLNNKNINIIGGDININNSKFYAPEGNINIISIKNNTDISFEQSNFNIKTLSINDSGNISISENSLLQTSDNGSGNILIYGKNIEISDTNIESESFGNSQNGNIYIHAFDLKLVKTNIFTNTFVNNNGGNIEFKADNAIKILNNSRIVNNTYGSGNAGKIIMDSNTILLDEKSVIESATKNSGNGGTISLIGHDKIELLNFSRIFSNSDPNINKAGNGGIIEIKTNKFYMKDNCNIATDTHSMGFGGNIILSGINNNYIDYISLLDSSIVARSVGIWVNSKTGNAGSISIFANNIELLNGSRIGSDSLLKSGGNGGNIEIDTNTILISGKNNNLKSSSIDVTAGTNEDYAGNAGNILIKANQITLTGSGSIIADSQGPGNAGNISIEVTTLQLINDAQISSKSQMKGVGGKAGNITIGRKIELLNDSTFQILEKSDLILLDGNNVSINTSTNGYENAGNIQMAAIKLDIINGADISSSTDYENYYTFDNISERDIYFAQKGDIAEVTVDKNSYPQKRIFTGDNWIIFNEYFEVDTIEEMNNLLNEKFITINDVVFVKNNDTKSPSTYIYYKSWIKINRTFNVENIEQRNELASLKELKIGDLVIVNNAVNSKPAGYVLKTNSLVDMDSRFLEYKIHLTENISELDDINAQIGDMAYINSALQMIYTGQQWIETRNTFQFDNFIDMYKYPRAKAGIMSEILNETDKNSNLFVHTGDKWILFNEIVSISNFDDTNLINFKNGDIVKIDNIDDITSQSFLYTNNDFKPAIKSGDAGLISIHSDSLRISNKAYISTSSNGLGKAGSIKINTQSLYMDNMAKIASSSNSKGNGGNAGLISIDAYNDLFIKDDKTSIETSSEGYGGAGDINLCLNNLNIIEKAKISSASNALIFGGPAGTIKINADESISLKAEASLTTEANNSMEIYSKKNKDNGKIIIKAGRFLFVNNSQITTSVKGGAGKGGDIETNSNNVVLNSGKIIANAFEGSGGNIHILSNQFIESTNSLVDASSEKGIDGIIKIESPEEDISRNIISLSDNFLDSSKWIKTPCASRYNEKVSHLVFDSYDGLPEILDDWKSSPPILIDDFKSYKKNK